ncbi:MAG: hypothetical protein IJ679_07090 [Lachnospiraceae bacterium]|nr:hypothetical protein [Lachnospiraceae bacterium]
MKIIAMVLSLLSWVTAYNIVEAAPANDAKAAYAKMLKRHPRIQIDDYSFYDAAFSMDDKSYVNRFALCDLDGDMIPELITETPVNFRWFIERIYTFEGGKVKPYKFSNGGEAVFNNCATANGGYYFYICDRNHVHNVYSGGAVSEEYAYAVSNKRLVDIALPNDCTDLRLHYFSNSKKNRKKLR